MSQKKYKKRHSQSTMNAKRQAAQAKLADEKERSRKRLDPTARNLLFGDLICMALCQILDQQGLISPEASAVVALLGLVVIVVALWFQFRPKKDH